MASSMNPKAERRIAWVKSFKSGEKWLLKLRKQYGEKSGTQKIYAMGLERFCEYMKMNPDEIIKAYTEALDENVRKAVDEWNDNLDLFVPWVIDKYDISRARATNLFTAVKSFFNNNVSIQLTTKTPAYHSVSKLPVTIDDIREKVLPLADLHERFIVTFLKDSGISQDDVLRLNVGDIEDKGNGFGYIRTFRAKENVDYETFIGPNAMNMLKKYLEYRERKGAKVDPPSPLFVKKTKLDERMTPDLMRWILIKLRDRTGVNISTHRLRKTFETFLALGRVHPLILKYWMGHRVKRGKADIEARYIIPPTQKQLETYMEAYKYIDVSPQPDQSEVLLAEIRTRMSALPPEHRQRFLKEISTAYRSRVKAIRSDKKIQELLKEYTDCPDGKHCPVFKEISEEELLAHLQDGWAVTHKLQNGRVIIQRD